MKVVDGGILFWAGSEGEIGSKCGWYLLPRYMLGRVMNR